MKFNQVSYPLLKNIKKNHRIIAREARLIGTAPRVADINDPAEYDFTKVQPPTQTNVVVCGGGVVGCSVAYHLAKDYGWKDVVLLDQGRLCGGTTWHAAGLLGQLKQSLSETKMCQYSIALYKSMEAQGLSTGWKECGSLMLAQTRDRMISFQRMAASAQARNVECEILTPNEAKNLCQLISTDNLQGALWIPGDGVGDPIEASLSLAGEAYRMGVKVVENCSVKRVLVDDRQNIRGVETNKGTIMCKYFVNSGGFWAPNIGQLSEPKVRVPTYPCEHHYLHTMPIKGLDPNIPVIRDFDGCFYVREKEGRIVGGGFEPTAKTLDMKQLPDSFAPLPEDWDQFHILLEQMLSRIPLLKEAKVDRLCNAAENFTPDCKWLLGETPEIKNYFIACGMKSIGMEAAGGVGQATAEWIVHGEPQRDLWDLDIRRFVGLHNNRLFLKDRMKEVPGLHYGIYYPFRQFETGRCLRMPPIYPRLKEAGAFFGQKMGFERPCYFAPDKFSSTDPLELGRVAHTRTFGKPSWFDYCKSEYQACRERVGLLDYSSFTKIELWSPGKEVVDFLQYLCSNDINIPTGSIAHTGMQNKWGGYENDCSIVRLADNHFFMIAPTDQHTRCQTWMKRHLPKDSPIALTDVTSMYTALCIMGPHSRDLLGDLTDTTMTPKDFPFFTYKEVDIGLASGIRAMNLTHTGELGWVLYIPNEYALHVYEHILKVGKKYGIQHAGYFAMRTLRIEKFYAFWGKDLDTTTTPLECGRSFRVKFEKGDFIGKDALLKQKKDGVTRRYIQLVLEDHNIDNEVWPWGDEPIYLNNKRVGSTTTTGYGFTLGKHVCLGFIHNFSEDGTPQIVTNDYILKNQFEINIGGKRYPAKANIHSPKLNFVELGYDSSYMATR